MKKPIEFIRGKKHEKKSIDVKKLFGDKKRILTGVGCAAIIAAAIWANIALNAQLPANEELEAVNEVQNTDEAVLFEVEDEPQDSLAVFRAQKDAARAEELSYLEGIVEDENSEDDKEALRDSIDKLLIDVSVAENIKEEGDAE